MLASEVFTVSHVVSGAALKCFCHGARIDLVQEPHLVCMDELLCYLSVFNLVVLL